MYPIASDQYKIKGMFDGKQFLYLMDKQMAQHQRYQKTSEKTAT